MFDFVMAKDQKHENAHVRENEQNVPDLISALNELIFESDPTLIITVGYAYLTGTGMYSSLILYRQFGINIFDYSEITDFVLAAFRNPIAFVSLGFTLLANVAYRSWIQRRAAKQEEMFRRTMRPDSTEEQRAQMEAYRALELRRKIMLSNISIALSLIVTTTIPPYLYVIATASSIKSDEAQNVVVSYRSFSGSAGQVTKPSLVPIGATQRAAFFYDAEEKSTLVIPQAQIVSIDVPE